MEPFLLEHKMTFGIYCLEHIASGRKYVGKSKHVEARIKGHRKAARGRRTQTFLCHALRKYGWGAFRWYVLEEVTPETPENLAARELHWIDTLDVFGTAEGFNTRRDSSSGTSFSEEVKRKIAASVKKLPIPDAMRHRWENPTMGKDNPFFGRTHSEESRRAMGAKVATKWQDPEYRKRMVTRLRGSGNAGQKLSKQARDNG